MSVIDGSRRARGDFIPLSVPEIRGKEWDYVKECLDTNWVSSVGAFVDRFEAAAAEVTERRFAVATVNGTAALHVALQLAGVEPGDEVVTSTLTFIAPANAIRYCGAVPVLIDAEPDTWQIDPQQIIDFLDQRCHWRRGALIDKATGRRVKALLPVHILGHPCDLDPILEAAERYELPVIEDAAEGLGARYRGRALGSRGDIGCLSFNGNKIITTGGGGMLVTDDEEVARKAKYLTTQAKDDPREYIHGQVGYNYRLTNLQSAMGCAQLEQLESYVEHKRHLAARYARYLQPLAGITPMPEAPWAESSFWMYTVLIDSSAFGLDRRAAMNELEELGIQSRPLWQPMHRSPAHTKDAVVESCPVADRLYDQALSLPCSVGLEEHDQDRVLEALRALAEKSRLANP
ncbi:MAG: LegC family aminotransferase [Acidobacteriota bacterium]